MQLFSLVGFSVFILLTGVPSSAFLIRGTDLVLVGLVVGVLNVFGLMQLYRAYLIGNMSLSAPIGGSYPIYTILIAFVILGEGIGLEKGIAIAIVILGVMITGINLDNKSPNDPSTKERKANGSAVLSALTASVFFGAAYVGLNAETAYFGSVLSIWFVRLGAVLFSFPFLLLTAKKFVLPTGGAWKWLLVMALLDSSGFATLTLGYIYSGNNPAIVTTLSSLLGAVTTILATIVYKDKLTRIQIIGIIILFLGVVIVLNV
jgi:drug/metabolite transporter (DMT)-like permease